MHFRGHPTEWRGDQIYIYNPLTEWRGDQIYIYNPLTEWRGDQKYVYSPLTEWRGDQKYVYDDRTYPFCPFCLQLWVFNYRNYQEISSVYQ